MNLNRIQYFIAVGRHSSFSQAAKELYVTQPAVSDAVKSLEKELGVMLFHRVKQRVQLTEEGRYYFEKVSRLMDDLIRVNSEMHHIGSHKKTVRLGIPPMIGSFVFPRVFTDFEAQYPDIHLELKEGGSLGLLHDLENEEIDLAIVGGSSRFSGSNPTLSFQKIMATELMFCVSSKHRLAGRKKINISEIEGERILLFKEGYIQKEIIVDCFREAGIDPTIILHTNQLFTIVTFIRQNIGSSFLYSDAAKFFTDIRAISFDKKIEVDLSLAWKTSRTRYNDVSRFVSFFKGVSEETTL